MRAIRSGHVSTILLLISIIIALTLGLGLGAGSLDARQDPPGLEELHRRTLPLFEIPGVVFTDADETADRIVVGVENPGLARAVEARLGALAIRAESVKIVITPPIIQLETLRDKVRPLDGGLQVRFSQYVCTLGFNVVRNGSVGFLTNSHCTERQGGVENTSYYQPLNQTAAEFIGTEVADPGYTKQKCPNNIKGKVCRWSDSAFAQLADGVAGDLGQIKSTSGPNNGSLDIAGGFQIVGEANAASGTVVNKVGRTTGWTQAPLTRTCVHTGVSGTNIVQLCQSFVESNSQVLVGGGDSGSPVFTITSGSNVHLNGILWGGSSDGKLFVFSPLQNIERTDEIGPLTTFGEPPANSAPTVTISDPAEGSTFQSGASVSFAGSAADTQDGNLTSSLVWTSSIDGQIGAGGAFSSALSDGTHTITASVMDFGGLEGSATVSITVGGGPPPPSSDAASVSSITYSTSGGRNNDKHLNVGMTVADGNGSPVGGATLSIALTNTDTGQTWNSTATTGADGAATFMLNNAPSGCYRSTITGLTASGYTWDGVTPVNEGCK